MLWVRGTKLAMIKWGKKRCEWGEARSGELHEHVIREEIERGSRRHQRAEGGLSALVIWAWEQGKLRRHMIGARLSRQGEEFSNQASKSNGKAKLIYGKRN